MTVPLSLFYESLLRDDSYLLSLSVEEMEKLIEEMEGSIDHESLPPSYDRLVGWRRRMRQFGHKHHRYKRLGETSSPF